MASRTNDRPSFDLLIFELTCILSFVFVQAHTDNQVRELIFKWGVQRIAEAEMFLFIDVLSGDLNEVCESFLMRLMRSYLGRCS